MSTIKQLVRANDEFARVDRATRQRAILEVIGQSSSFLISHDDYVLSTGELQRYLNFLQKLQTGMPFAYVVGHQAFWKHDFIVNQHTLIPRPDTEILVETVLNSLKNSLSKNSTILDLGTGSGCIAISIASENKTWQVTAIDYSEEALAVARKNAQILAVSNISFLKGNWLEPLNKQDKFDVIVSNPPYISPSDPHLSGLTNEPYTALVAADNGLADIHHIVKNSIKHIKNNGKLFIEHGYNQAAEVQEIFAMFGYSDIATIKDYGNNDRVTFGTWLM